MDAPLFIVAVKNANATVFSESDLATFKHRGLYVTHQLCSTYRFVFWSSFSHKNMISCLPICFFRIAAKFYFDEKGSQTSISRSTRGSTATPQFMSLAHFRNLRNMRDRHEDARSETREDFFSQQNKIEHHDSSFARQIANASQHGFFLGGRKSQVVPHIHDFVEHHISYS